MSNYADSIIAAHEDRGEPSPRSTNSYSTYDSRDQFIRPTPERAVKILQRLLYDKMNDRYDIPEVFDKHIRIVIEKFCTVSVETQGSLEALDGDNVVLFMQAMENNRDHMIIRDKPCTLSRTPSSSTSDTSNNLGIQKRESPRRAFNDSLRSMTSINSQDSDNTKSIKKVSSWKKNNKYTMSSSLEEREKDKEKIETKKIKTAGGQKYYDLLENIIERLERIEKKIDSYEFTE